MTRQLETVVTLFVRALPLLVLFVTFIFLQNEAWQITSELHGPFYWIVLALFPLVGVLFVAIRLPMEIGQLSDFESWQTVVELVESTPIDPLAKSRTETLVATAPLGRRQWGNVGLVVLFSQLVQVPL